MNCVFRPRRAVRPTSGFMAAIMWIAMLPFFSVNSNAETFAEVAVSPKADMDNWRPAEYLDRVTFNGFAEQARQKKVTCSGPRCLAAIEVPYPASSGMPRSVWFECAVIRHGTIDGPPHDCKPRFQKVAEQLFAAPLQLIETAFGGREAHGFEIFSPNLQRDPILLQEIEAVLRKEPFSLSVEESYDKSSLEAVSEKRRPLLLPEYRLEWITIRISHNRPSTSDGKQPSLNLSVADTIMVNDYNTKNDEAFSMPRQASEKVVKLLRDKIIERLRVFCGKPIRPGPLQTAISC